MKTTEEKKTVEYGTAKQWWENTSNETKQAITGFSDPSNGGYYHRLFWGKLSPTEKNNLFRYWKHRKGLIKLSEGDAYSLQIEIISELADRELERLHNIPVEDMTDDEGSFYEEYQDQFNNIYDEIEDRILNSEL